MKDIDWKVITCSLLVIMFVDLELHYPDYAFVFGFLCSFPALCVAQKIDRVITAIVKEWRK